MVAAVNRLVAVRAAAIEFTIGWPRAVRVGRCVIEGAGVPRIGVALLAEERCRSLLQLEVIRAMRRVAVQATLPNWGVLPEEGSSLLCVTRVALIVDRRLQEHALSRRAVRVVTVGATYLALANRVVRTLPGLGANVLVTLEALFLSRVGLELLGLRLETVYGMTGEARQAALCMRTVVPEELLLSLVAALTSCGLLIGRELHDGRQ